MIPVLTAVQAAEWDERARRQANIPSRVLMEAAGRAVAWVIAREYPDELRAGVLLAAGHGNNGGDGWVAARALRAAGARVWAVEVPNERSPDCDANRTLALGGGVELLDAEGAWPAAGVVIDALLGTGAGGAPRGAYAGLAARLAAERGVVVAVDGPTGLDLSTGEAHGPVRAALTVTFGGVRVGHLLKREWCGTVIAVDIGFPPPDAAWSALVTDQDAAAWLPPFHSTMHKGDRGRVLVVGGAAGMAGAALHACSAALAAGAGLVKLVASDQTVRAAQASLPDVLAVTSDLGPQLDAGVTEAVAWADAIVLGPGLGRGPARAAFVEGVLAAAAVPVIIDADALHAGLKALRIGRAPRVFTPHPGEFRAMFAELSDAVESDRFHAAAAAARRVGGAAAPAVVLLKGVPSVIASDGAPLRVVAAGNPALATGGSGDLLAGFIGAFLARRVAPLDAASLGAQVLGRAAELAAADFTARATRPADVLAALPGLWRRWAAPRAIRPPELVRLEPVALI